MTAKPIPSFEIGKAYYRKAEITGRFGGSGQSGIAPSSQSPVVFLFTGDSGEQYGYTDRFDESGCLLYTGEGQTGNMQMKNGNKAIASHAVDGRALHVFKSTGHRKPYIYVGEFVYDSHFIRRGPDREGEDRDVIVFRLLRASELLQVEQDENVEAAAAAGMPTSQSLADLRAAAIAACQPQAATSADNKETVRKTYQRSAQVKKYVLARSQGICELCDQPAPFNRKSDGSPYLEPHHINRLSDGGLDHPVHVAAICPTCHRLIHFGVNGQQQNEILKSKIEVKETAT
ncbi:HNH endonuclease [Crenobacter sp. SG2305]|uniref:HNH endonuclease n=1 Tax=Crenobacter oryzisoli TaxID=3056844 RepID=UPI0025AACA91|nr:HNH endonuclease [Crenobacter sp. SG2305]MDN0081643.1 HNH endonuclease [Crenobacter sp. SG2305]